MNRALVRIDGQWRIVCWACEQVSVFEVCGIVSGGDGVGWSVHIVSWR